MLTLTKRATAMGGGSGFDWRRDRSGEHPLVREANARLHELVQRRDELGRRLEEIEEAIAESGGRRSTLDLEAEALIAGRPDGPGAPDRKPELERVERELRVARRAVDIQQKAVAEAYRAAEAEIRAAAAPARGELVDRLIAAGEAFRDAMTALLEFEGGLEDRGVPHGGPWHPWAWGVRGMTRRELVEFLEQWLTEQQAFAARRRAGEVC